MTMLSENDWELVSAYADGELPESQAGVVAARLIREPELSEALSEVRRAKAALAQMAPLPVAPRPAAGRIRGFAAAAALAAVVTIGVLYGYSNGGDWRSAPAEMHAALSDKTYVLPDSAALPVISTARIGDVRAFDLSSSRLTLVDVQSGQRDGRDLVAMHYRGRNGCRLTVVAVEAMAGDPETLPAGHGGMGASWTTGSIHFQLLASGMDRNRFRAIVAYAEAESQRLNPQGDLRIALRSATDRAQPCA